VEITVTTKLSVNLNKVALIRNSRDTVIPSVVEAAEIAIAAGAQGITVHPRPDQRHIRPGDVRDLSALLAQEKYQDIEFNIEGNPYAGPEAGYPGFLELVNEVKPHQATLVPDDPTQLTSDHGWDLRGESNSLGKIIDSLKQDKIRVSLFMDPDVEQITRAAQIGSDRIEFYTGPFADHFPHHESILPAFIESAKLASKLGLGLNAGHDLNLDNLGTFCGKVPRIDEVSIGHAIITDALWMGLSNAVQKYRRILNELENENNLP
jgi:pyridoxine 5-phosphate synthase